MYRNTIQVAIVKTTLYFRTFIVMLGGTVCPVSHINGMDPPPGRGLLLGKGRVVLVLVPVIDHAAAPRLHPSHLLDPAH